MSRTRKQDLSLLEQTLDKLLADIRSGKKDAFDRFLTLIQETVYSFGMKVCGREADAGDAMQDTLLRAFRSLPKAQFQNAAALKVWLYKVAKNACLMMRRKGKFEPAVNLSLDELLLAGGHRTSLAIADWSNLPVNALVKKETEQTVRKAIQKLPALYSVVLVLRDMEQLSTKETAAILDISEQTVKIRLHRARLFMRKELEKSLLG